MPNLSERDYTKLANAAAKDLVEHQIDLNESVDKLASNRQMNDEQLTRLVEATNNAAFNAMFEAKGKVGSADRLVEFKVASVKEILDKRISTEKARGETKVAAYVDEVWESRPLRSQREIEDSEQVKVAAYEEPAPSASKLARNAFQDAERLEKAIEHLRIEKIGSEVLLNDAVRETAAHFRSINTADRFPAFEKEAMALYGRDADVILDDVRASLRLQAVTRDYAKTASMIVMSTSSPAHTAMKRAIDHQTRLANIQTTLARHGRG